MPIVFVHGNGDSGALWQTTVWRFESNGWPTGKLHAIDLPFPLARDEDPREQPGRTSTAEHMAYLKAEVDAVIQRTGAEKVILVGNSRGGNAIRNYIQNGGGETKVSHAILAGTPNHGIWAVRGMRESSEFSGTGPFLTSLNAPKNTRGDEVAPAGQMADHPVRQQRQVRAARWPLDRLPWHAHQCHLRGPGTARCEQRHPRRRRSPGDGLLACRVRRDVSLHHFAKRRRPSISCRTRS